MADRSYAEFTVRKADRERVEFLIGESEYDGDNGSVVTLTYLELEGGGYDEAVLLAENEIEFNQEYEGVVGAYEKGQAAYRKSVGYLVEENMLTDRAELDEIIKLFTEYPASLTGACREYIEQLAKTRISQLPPLSEV